MALIVCCRSPHNQAVHRLQQHKMWWRESANVDYITIPASIRRWSNHAISADHQATEDFIKAPASNIHSYATTGTLKTKATLKGAAEGKPPVYSTLMVAGWALEWICRSAGYFSAKETKNVYEFAGHTDLFRFARHQVSSRWFHWMTQLTLRA